MSSHLKLQNITVEIDGQTIVESVSLTLEDGQIGSLLGPSGCGKTTLLRTIAGFQRPKNGEIWLKEQQISSHQNVVAPESRNIGMVFQDLALFPHLNIQDNVAFGIRKLPSAERSQRVKSLLKLVALEDHAKKYPHELSGGQQQRIALIRAMAPRPQLLLLDEPFSGQDIELREQLAREVRSILIEDGITALLVTHDQYEAFAFSDVIGVMNKGHMHQWDNGFDLYHEPTDRFVADFIGQGVFVKGTVLDQHRVDTEMGVLDGEIGSDFPPGSEIELLVRPDDVIHDDHSTNFGNVIEKSFRGADHLYTLELPGKTRVLCLAPSHHNHHIGESIGVRLELDHLVMFPSKS